MATTITDGVTTITVRPVDEYETVRETRNVILPIIGTNVPAVVLRDAGLRSGSMTVLVDTHAAALALSDLLGGDDELTLASTDLPGAGMGFVCYGSIRVALEEETRLKWLVTFDFQETI